MILELADNEATLLHLYLERSVLVDVGGPEPFGVSNLIEMEALAGNETAMSANDVRLKVMERLEEGKRKASHDAASAI